MSLELKAGSMALRLEGELGSFTASLSTRDLGADRTVVTLDLRSPTPARPAPLRLCWSLPIIDIQGYWHPGVLMNRGLMVSWGSRLTSRATTGAPVVCLFSQQGANRLTFACSDARDAVTLLAGVREETANMDCFVQWFGEAGPAITHYRAEVLLDRGDRPYHDSLAGVSDWWASHEGYTPAPVPEIARRPMYSTWYCFHQNLDPAEVEKQCRIARGLGCEAVIVDDGWQTLDSNRGYRFCGDWEPDRIPDLAGHVQRVHDLGMKFILWYSVPFIGDKTRAFARFQGKFLSASSRHNAYVLDPRFPEAREFLIALYERAMREWNLDGFKFDFVDSFRPFEDTPQATPGDGRDIQSVPEAADRLLSDIMARLRAINPEVMIEFRQSYIGPLMRKYGNMFRAGDCPNDALTQRVRTLDIRLLCGNTAAHADMFMWHPDEPVHSAALQMINALFAVPQVSVLLDKIPADHLDMVRFWLSFWRAHRDALLDGKFEPMSPELLYPLVIASTPGKRIAVVYGDVPARLAAGGAGMSEQWVVNGTLGRRVILDLTEDLGTRSLEVLDCRGRPVGGGAQRQDLGAGLHAIAVPPAGLVRIGR